MRLALLPLWEITSMRMVSPELIPRAGGKLIGNPPRIKLSGLAGK